jgi:hypothetical protein
MAFWRAIGRQAVRPGNGCGHGYFPPALWAFASRNKIAATCAILRSAPALRFRYALAGFSGRDAPGSGPVRPPSGDRHEGRDGRGRSSERTSP